ncbi:MAG: serine/threonine-protein kinase [Anaerolineales bacterium]|jgi:tRNA A-37 threonylcarbamoyl transferase component Bud32
MDNLVGQNLGRYHIIEPLGQGGMASVYKAFDTTLERNVAIKIIRTDVNVGADQAQFLKRFQREAKALAQLDHPYILKVLDYGEQAGIPYLVMPFVEGGTLKEKMGQPVPYQEAAALLAPIARALEYAHQLKIIHRDVKPANILISRSGAPILSDFGIAKMMESGESTQLTATGVGIGTPDYMAPEQWMGKSDPHTDMYSLGIVFFQMVTGHLPFSADTPAAVLIKHMQDPLPRPRLFVPELPESVEQVLFKALAKDPKNRFPNMGVFAELLEKLSRGEEAMPAAVTQLADASQATVVNMHAVRAAATVAAPVVVPSVHKRMAGWKIGLIVLGGVAVVAVLLVVIGTAYYASRYVSAVKPATLIPPAAAVTQGNPLAAGSTQILPAQTQPQPATQPAAQPTAVAAAATTVTPFLTIKGFPADIPILTDNDGDLTTTTTAASSGNPAMTMYTFSTKMPLQQVSDFYKNGMVNDGWTIINTTTGNNMTAWTFTKGDNRTVELTIVTSTQKAAQQVMIMIQ